MSTRQTVPPGRTLDFAVQTVEVTKTYGHGPTAVTALDRVSVALPLAVAGRRAEPAWVDRVVDAVGLRDRLGHRPAELSGGQQQRLADGRVVDLMAAPTAGRALDRLKALGG